ncbi:MAG: FliH/SctL family protein, partial [Fervidobacterium pennivorans]
EKKEFSEKLSNILVSFDVSIQKMLDDFAERLTSISKVLVEKFLEKQIDDEVTKRKLIKVLTHIIGATKVKIRINPEDLKIIDSDILNEIRTRGYELIPDSSVSYGVITETDLGTIDTTLNFQFVLLDEIFEEVFRGENT